MSTCWCSTRSASTSWLPTVGSPAATRIRGSPLTIVSESARLFWLNVSWPASTTTRKMWKPASFALTWNVTVVWPTGRFTCWVEIRPPSAKRRTVASWATVEVIVAFASMSSPRCAVVGVVTRSTRTSAEPPRPVTWVWTWIPCAAARAASACPAPVVSLPSDSRTIRFCASSGKRAAARRRAPPMSVAPWVGTEAIASSSRTSSGSRSTSASLPNATMPARSSWGIATSASRT